MGGRSSNVDRKVQKVHQHGNVDNPSADTQETGDVAYRQADCYPQNLVIGKAMDRAVGLG